MVNKMNEEKNFEIKFVKDQIIEISSILDALKKITGHYEHKISEINFRLNSLEKQPE